ncbi:MAG TPA: 2-dehydro-3-deoxygalactonokinase [Caulobacteraceae bacterium]|jgi:2-dehydro-3-deoxygalactonokinase|nr:2-dehydro-3-deoxygalactonokinase [Caulobacteraceae bacterium]
MTSPAFLAVDWGTTNLRAWVIDDAGAVVQAQDFPLGVSKLAPGEAARKFIDTVRPALGAQTLPAILCGMVGSNLGWEEVPYFDCPADLAALAGGLRRVDIDGPPVRIVPGLRCRRPDGCLDVMRGEEVQVLGWAAGAPERRRGSRLICHPGTHAKWVRLQDGRIEHFVTAMTGELFELLRKYSVLQVREAAEDDDAFDEGLRVAGDGGGLAAQLFTARSRVVGGEMAPEKVRSYLSGLLIGAEAASLPALAGASLEEPVALIGDPALCAHYRKAIERTGRTVSVHDGDAAAISGLAALYRMEPAR